MKRAALAMLTLGAPALADDAPIPYPHPVITEILYDVPTRALGGDANQDGEWTSLGEQFVELLNPHDEAIELGGYSISDTHREDRYHYRFVIPDGTLLEPGQTLLIFNGFRQTEQMPAPYGDKRTPCSEPNEAFHGAIVYSVKNLTSTRAFSTQGDICALRDPNGNVVELIEWGSPIGPVPDEAMRRTRLPVDVAFSFQRLGPWNAMLPHIDIDGERYSPGVVPSEITAGAPTDDDAGATDDDTLPAAPPSTQK